MTSALLRTMLVAGAAVAALSVAACDKKPAADAAANNTTADATANTAADATANTAATDASAMAAAPANATAPADKPAEKK